MNQVIEVIKSRRSTRKYLPDQIKQEELDLILEAGSYAPSAHNEQPWHFTVIQNKEVIENLDIKTKKIMAKQSIDWVKKMSENEKFKVFYDAPTIVIVSGKENALSPIVDCSAAIQNILLSAESLNIGSCWIGLARFVFELEEERSKLDIPKEYKPYYAICLGYKTRNAISKGPKRKENIVNYIR